MDDIVVDWDALYEDALNQVGTDYIVRAGNKTVHCHAPVLASQSIFFEAIIDSGFTSEFEFPAGSILESYLDEVIKFLYIDEVEFTDAYDNAVIGMLQSAAYIDCRDLTEYCQEKLVDVVNEQNYVACNQIAEAFGLHRLRDICQLYSNDE